MALGIQIDEGEFTRLHNTILEKLALARFTASEYRCLMFLFRMTYGWQKKDDAISLSQWAKGTGIDMEKRHNVLRTLQGLLAKRVIYAKPNGNNHPATWGFNKHFDQWDASLFNETVISPDNSSCDQTVISPDNKPDPSVMPLDNSAVISPDNKTVISPDNHKRKKEISKEKGRERTPNGAPPPIDFGNGFPMQRKAKVYANGIGRQREAIGLSPAEFSALVDVVLEHMNATAIASQDTDIGNEEFKQAQEATLALAGLGHKTPEAIGALFDTWWTHDWRGEKGQSPKTYKEIVEHAKAMGKKVETRKAEKPKLSEAERGKLVSRARTAQGNIRTAETVGGRIDPQWQRDIETAKGYGLI